MPDEPIFVSDDARSPGVILWFKLYTGFLSFIYLLCIGLSLIFLFVEPAKLEMDAVSAKVMGAVLLVMGLGLFVACLVPLVVAQRPWVWIYDLIIICFGFTSVCLWPICIPLLIFWLKPETKEYFRSR